MDLLLKPPAPPMMMMILLEFFLFLSARHSLPNCDFLVDLRTKVSIDPTNTSHFPDTIDSVPTKVIV